MTRSCIKDNDTFVDKSPHQNNSLEVSSQFRVDNKTGKAQVLRVFLSHWAGLCRVSGPEG